jgi:hypothetical protein
MDSLKHVSQVLLTLHVTTTMEVRKSTVRNGIMWRTSVLLRQRGLSVEPTQGCFYRMQSLTAFVRGALAFVVAIDKCFWPIFGVYDIGLDRESVVTSKDRS